MNMRILAAVGAVSGLLLSACVVTSGPDDGDGGSGGAATTSATTTTTHAGGTGGATTTTTHAGGAGGSGGAAACGKCLDQTDPANTLDLCEDDNAAIDAFNTWADCMCDATAGCGAECGDNVCDSKEVTDACWACATNQSGACKTQLHACTLN
jgi:hypothetical protein